MRAFSARRDGARGFTLIELGIVIGLLAVVAMLAIPSMEAAFGVKTREDVARVAGAIRAMYGEAVLSGRTCRLVFDLSERAYWPECAEGRVRVSREEESVRGRRVDEEKEKRRFGNTEEEEDARRQVEQRNAFAAYEANLAPKVTFREGISFESIWTQHQSEPYTEGTSYLYFFPNGQSERAYVYVTDGSETWTVVVDPMTGRTRVEPEKLAIPSKEMR